MTAKKNSHVNIRFRSLIQEVEMRELCRKGNQSTSYRNIDEFCLNRDVDILKWG